MKIRLFLVRLDETRTTDHFPFILRFRLEHGRLESASISQPQTQFWADKLRPFSGHYLATILPKNEFDGCSSTTCNPDQVDPNTRTPQR
ncbi:calcium-transporting ATPase 12 [Pyrus ussuriensis x Pyrus communis]|uniref:Calcium-transporting ATPase 12 n=1 Tax=Pyrus ussuriensis x Pyrus communis TaxID=2448454 RepID=A0A5N5H770_9ROSA|nr:calcium-transporting ATPase 12 [Pyrus ussuriensis x Pyrus communis]